MEKTKSASSHIAARAFLLSNLANCFQFASVHEYEPQTDSWMPHVHQIIVIADQHNIHIIVVGPLCCPRVTKLEEIAAVSNSPVSALRYVKVMLFAKISAEFFLGD